MSLPGDPSFDRYARMVRRTLHAPVALVSMVETDRQVFIGAEGLEVEPWASTRETPLTHSFCQYVVADRRPLIVSDAREEARLRTNLAIPDLGVVAYAGWPLTDHTGTVVGSLCAIDGEPRRWSDEDIEALSDLAASCSAEIAQRELRRIGLERAEQAEHLRRRSEALLALSERLSTTRTLLEVAEAVEQVGTQQLGCLRTGIWLRDDLDRVEEGVDASAVTTLEYLDDGTGWHGARANSGVPNDDTNPIGAAFTAGSAAFYRDRDTQDAIFGTEWLARGPVRDPDGARACIPVSHGGVRFGTLVLLWPEPRELGADDRITLQAFTSYTGQALGRAVLIHQRDQVATTLQRAMLTALPDVPGTALAAAYRPAFEREQVGGDWYDAISLRSGATALVIGDVVGHDIEAAADMGLLRSTLRALTWAADDKPSVDVGSLDRALPDLGIATMASLLLLRVEPAGSVQDDDGHVVPGSRLLRWSNAGHPPPVLVRAGDCPAELLGADDGDLMVGVLPGSLRTDHEAVLHPGDTILLYTDGLVERRDEDLSVGAARLLEAAGALGALPLAAMVENLLDALLAPPLRDDVAVLAVRVVDDTVTVCSEG